MKKMYVAPEVETIKVNAMNMLAGSLPIGGDSNEGGVDTSVPGTQLGREDNNPSSPNLWEQGW